MGFTGMGILWYDIFKERCFRLNEKDLISKPFYQNPLVGKCPFHAHCEKLGIFTPHWHGELEIMYLPPDSGPAVIKVDDVRYTLKARDAFLIDSTLVHSIEKVENNTYCLILEMGFPLLGTDFNLFAKNKFKNSFISFSENDSPWLNRLEEIFLQLAKEKNLYNYTHEDDSTVGMTMRMKVSSCLFEIAALLAENMEMIANSGEKIRQLQAMLAVQSVLSYVRENYSDPISVDKAAELIGYEKTRFCQIFKQAVGIPFHRYLNRLRLDAAISMLKETTLPICVIADTVGIPQAKTFSRLVKDIYGCTPKELRDAVRSDETMNYFSTDTENSENCQE